MAKKVKLPIRKPEEVIDQITFSAFFNQCLHRELVKSWQERELYVFFRGLGLLDKEPSQKYLDALAKY